MVTERQVFTPSRRLPRTQENYKVCVVLGALVYDEREVSLNTVFFQGQAST